MQKKRNQSIELYRIYCIFFIIAGHLIGYFDISPESTLNIWLVRLSCSLSSFCVDGFVLITGYFMITQPNRLDKLFKLLVETTFYVFGISLLVKLLGLNNVSSFDLVKSLFILAPTKFNLWFITKYTALLLLHTFLSKIPHSISKKQYILLLSVLLFLNTELVVGFPLGEQFGTSWSLLWFITIYFIGGYIRLYGLGLMENKTFVWSMLCILLIVIQVIVQMPELQWIKRGYNSPITISLAISSFMLFKNFKCNLSGVSYISKHVLSCYIIHQHAFAIPIITSLLIGIIAVPEYDSVLLIPWLMFSAFIVFVTCVLIDKIRTFIFIKTGINAKIDNLGKRIQTHVESL